MKRLIIFLIVLAASVWLGIQIQQDPGYVLLANRRWTVEMPLWLAVLSFILLLVIAYILISFIHKTGALPSLIKRWSRRRRLRKAYAYTERGLLALIEGRWQAAEKDLLRGVIPKKHALLNYLAAAYAAQEIKAYKRCEDYIKQIQQQMPQAALAIGMAQAQLKIKQEQYLQAMQILERLQKLAPKQPYLLKLLQVIYLKTQAWDKLQQLLPALRQGRVLNQDEQNHIEIQTYVALLKTHTDLEDIQTLWEDAPREIRKNIQFKQAYIEALITHKAFAEAEEMLKDTLNKTWDAKLAAYYGDIIAPDPEKQFITAENWLHQHSQEPLLMLSLGRICMRKQLWGKARNYFESCIAIAELPEAYLALGQLFEQLGDSAQAKEYYKHGLTQTLSSAH